MRKLRWLLLLGAVVLEAGCGLPDEYYLMPPRVSGQFALTSQNAQITGTNRSDDILIQFIGYELYYKFFAPNDPSSTYLQDQNYGGPNNTVSDLQQHGFQRVCLGPGPAPGGSPDRSPGYSSAPLINIQNIDSGNLAGGGYAINIIMNDLHPPAFISSSSGAALLSYFTYAPPPGTTPTTGMEIRRFVQEYPYIESGQFCAPFASNLNWQPTGLTPHNFDDITFGQVDIQALQPAWLSYVAGSGTIYIMMYAVSYGLSTQLNYQRSSPVYLGYTPIQVLN